ncbi:nuclear pore complex protein Nup155-like [Uloborus diversus]|uniref:nuclear pore complex protein Nup155-like n=1 Tax=Uloborus diversus TaxID=327109 RepID=UPI002409213B|nr:nuclear pore complex protein Nup155-like [Uloborus diversus]
MVRAMAPEHSLLTPLNGVQKDVLEASAKMVDVQMQVDNSFPELIERLKMGGATLPTVSGLNDQDYPGVSELSISLHNLTQLSTVKRIPLPPELVEQFSLMQSNCQMGLFPDIGRAWLTIDSNIFIWSFHDGSDLAYHDGLNETILCVGLVKPKKDIFVNSIRYLLCLTTPVEIVVFGVEFSRQNKNSSIYEEIHLMPEPLFSYPTDNVHMCTFQGTDDGRIFLGGKDGSIYEFSYQAQDSWFSRKCRKINHSSSSLSFLVPTFLSLAFSEDDAILQIAVDNSRHILYARLEKGSIQVYDLGKDGKQMSKVHTLYQHAIVQQASEVARTIDKKNFYPVVHISAVEAHESKHVHLVAVTQSGVRLYFTTNGSFGDSRPYTLALLHVRLPPGFTANAAVARPSNVHMAYYKKGFLLLASSQAEDNDVIFATSNDSFAFYSQLIETHTTMMLDGHAWALAEVPSDIQLKQSTASTEMICDPPVLVTQHRELPRQFVFLSSQGFVLRKPRPVDHLYKLLLDNKGADNEAVKAFFMFDKDAQACAMCLILACCQNLQEKQIAEWATQAFFLYGGEPQHNIMTIGDSPLSPSESQMTFSRPSSPMPPVWVSTPQNQQRVANFPQPQFSNIFSPVQSAATPQPQQQLPSGGLVSQQLSTTGVSSPTSEILYSGKHNGLYLYFSRIIRPLWNMKLVSEKTSVFEDSKVTFLVSNVEPEPLSIFLQELLSLKQFLQKNNQSFLTPAISNLAKNVGATRLLSKNLHSSSVDVAAIASPYQRKSQNDAEVQERISMSNFTQLVNYTYEMLALWKLLLEHPFQSAVSFLPQEQLDLMKLLTFKEFIIDGRELSTALTNSLINYYLEDIASTSAISQRLRELCPTIYRIEDATVSRAHEIVLNAKNIVNKAEKEKELIEALKLCKSIAPNVDLGLMCNLFRGAGFYNGIVDLCLCCAQRRDPQGLALHYYKNGEPQDDQQGMQAFINRMKCYKNVIEAIKDLMLLSMSHPQSPSIPKVPGPPPSRDPNLLAPEEAKVYSEEIFNMALKTDDELFHVALYDWLIENNQTDTLLFIKSHFLEDYLKRCTTLRPDNSYILDLLWKYYEKNQNFSAASRVLAKLAEKHGVDMTLVQRIEYLSRAIMCVKGSEMRISASGEGEFLHELEEKMEVARIQLQILEAVEQKKMCLKQRKVLSRADNAIDDAIARLNNNFLDIQRLYEDFALVFDLPESQLAIVQCGGLYDPALIDSLWKNIIDTEVIATLGNEPDTRVKLLQQKLISISQAYIGSDKYFPLAFIIKYLELKTCALNFNPCWVFETILSLGVSIVELMKIYHNLYRSKDSCWTTSGKPLHLLSVLVLLIGHFTDNPTSVPVNERRTFTAFCLDVISGYLVDLQAMDTSIANVPILMREFKAVQRKLERLP